MAEKKNLCKEPQGQEKEKEAKKVYHLSQTSSAIIHNVPDVQKGDMKKMNEKVDAVLCTTRRED